MSIEHPSRIHLARLPTPIQKLEKTSAETGKEIFVWRDDLNGMLESGNKLRKLEYLLADALSKGCDSIITCGGPQSNHTRATSIVARRLGLEVHLLVLPRPGFDPNQTPNANWLMNKIFGAHIDWLDYEAFQKTGLGYQPWLEEKKESLISKGLKPYVIPLGGSNALGCEGYRTAVPEMLQTWKTLTGTRSPDDLFCTLGSGGTLVGLEWGLQENAPDVKLHGVNVIGALEIAQKYVRNLHQNLSENAGIDLSCFPTQIIDGYTGSGYSIASDEDLRFYSKFAQKEGMMLDPCYTGKAFQGMLAEIRKNPETYGERILFLHSGGALGSFAYANQYQHALE